MRRVRVQMGEDAPAWATGARDVGLMDRKSNVTFSPRGVERSALAFSVAISAMRLSSPRAVGDDPGIDIGEIERTERAFLGEHLTSYDVADCILEARDGLA